MTATSPRAGQAAVDAHRFLARAGTNSSADQGRGQKQAAAVGAGSIIPGGQVVVGAHSQSPTGETNSSIGQDAADNHDSPVDAGPNFRDSHSGNGAHSPAAVAGQTSGQTIPATTPMVVPSARTQAAQSTMRVPTTIGRASAGQPISPMAIQPPEYMDVSLSGDQNCGSHTACPPQLIPAAAPNSEGHHAGVTHQATAFTGRSATATGVSPLNEPTPWLSDPFLALAADVLDDLEQVRVANSNRLEQLCRTEPDADGITRGFGLDQTHPDVARLAAIVDTMATAEHAATLNLQRTLRKHPLGPWVKSMGGVGEKQAARLLAAIGDPYIRPEMHYADGRPPEPARPRTVSELWAYCGYHVVPAGHPRIDAHDDRASGDPASVRHSGSGTHGFRADGTNPTTDGNPGQVTHHAHPAIAGVAAARTRGQRANWSSTAKAKAWLIADSCVKQLKRPCRKDPDHGYAIHEPDCRCSPYRVVYDQAKAKYADATHRVPCVRCGPAGKPAQPGTPLSDGHKHARAMRLVAKTLLRDLWVEAKRIHEDVATNQPESG